MASAKTIPHYEGALDWLARTIQKHRNDRPAHETARQLLEYDRPGHMALVGVRKEASQAVLCYEPIDTSSGSGSPPKTATPLSTGKTENDELLTGEIPYSHIRFIRPIPAMSPLGARTARNRHRAPGEWEL